MNILGIHCIGHDTSAALLRNGRLISAVEEERFNGEKHTQKFPKYAVEACLKAGNISCNDIDMLVLPFDFKQFIQKRYLQFWNEYYPDNRQRVLDELDELKKREHIIETVREKLGYQGHVYQCHHHTAHMASAYFISQFNKSALYSIDGVGDGESVVSGYAEGNQLTVFNEKSVWYPHSLGLLYTSVTAHLGFIPHCDEGKTMGLAPYGDSSVFRDVFQDIIHLNEDGTHVLTLDYLNYPYVRKGNMSNKFAELCGSQRIWNEPIEQHHMDIAAALQERLEEAIIHALQVLHIDTGSENLSLAGGVALNCMANGKIISNTGFRNISIQPAANDSGTALGGVLYYYYCKTEFKWQPPCFSSSVSVYSGPVYTNSEVKSAIRSAGLKPDICGERVYQETAKLLKTGKIVGWFNGGMEFGPRALGNRSILTAPFPAEMKDILNRRVKHREDFRPFAPVVLQDRCDDYFDSDHDSPYMLFTWRVKDHAVQMIPAVTHINKSARVQTVTPAGNPELYRLIKMFEQETGEGVLLNTSFNVMGQPIVNTPQEALETFLANEIDYLVMNGHYLISKPIINGDFI